MAAQKKTSAGDQLRGAHVRVRVTTAASNFTMLSNSVLRNEFRRPEGGAVQLRGLDRAALLQLLSYSWARTEDPEWRLDMDEFVDSFTESRSTVYAALARLENEGFLLRSRTNDPQSGQFVWHWDVTDQPGTLAPAGPQRRSGPATTIRRSEPRSENPDMDPAPGETRRSPADPPCSGNPHMADPHMARVDAATSYREDLSLPTSHTTSTGRARETPGGGDAGGTSPMMASPPRPASVRDRLPAEVGRTPDPAWVAFAAELANHEAARGHLIPNRAAQELVALRCQIAHGIGWTTESLRRLLLTGLDGCQHLAGTWLYRLHPDHLPTPGRDAVPITDGRRTPQCGQCDARPGDPVSARVVWLDENRTQSEPCPNCHPAGIARRPRDLTSTAS